MARLPAQMLARLRLLAGCLRQRPAGFAADERGVVAVIFAITFCAVFLAVAVAIDYARTATEYMRVQGIQSLVAEAGIDYRVRHGNTNAGRADGPPAIRLAYQRPVAVPPPCDQWTEDVGRNEARIPYPNWGCATQRNLALMVDNARDLQQPQEEDPRSSERRSVTWSAYVGSGSSGGDGGGDAAKKAPASAVKK